MYFLKKVIGLGGNENKQESKDFLDERFQFQSEAVLYRLEKDTKIQIFPKCLVKFLSNPQRLFEYSLYFKDLSPKNEGNAQEYFFPVHDQMNLQSSYTNSKKDGEKISFIWLLDPDNTMNLEFLNINNGLGNAMFFKDILCKLIYETIYKKSALNVKNDEEYLKYCRDITKSSEKQTPIDVIKKVETIEKKEKKQEYIDFSKIIPDFTSKKGVLLCNLAKYLTFEKNDEEKTISETVIFIVQDKGDFEYDIELYNENKKKIYNKQINGELNFDLNPKENTLKWVDFTGNSLTLLMLRFQSFGVGTNLQFLLNKCLFENNRKESLEHALTKDELQYASNFLAQDQMEIEEENIAPFSNFPDLQIDDFYSNYKQNDDLKNRTFSQAKLLDRTFLSKGSIINVFKTEEDNDDNIEFICSLPKLKTLDNKNLFTKKLLLHEQDSKVLILNEDDNKKVYYMDLEKGKVVSELYPDGENSILDICSDSKHSNLTQNPLFLGINQKNLFKIDPRVNPKEAAVSKKIYASNYKFNTITTNENGNFAVGNELGEIRLYNEMGKNAKNLYPGLGDEILSIDCTKDGKWVLATCKNYLLLVPAFHQEKNAFTHTIKNIEKPTPKLLKIHPKDVLKLGNNKFEFSNGKFDDSENRLETYIVAGFGNAIINWNMKNILEGKIFEYTIKILGEKIMDSEFKFNNTEKMLIALPNEMRMHKIKKIKGKK